MTPQELALPVPRDTHLQLLLGQHVLEPGCVCTLSLAPQTPSTLCMDAAWGSWKDSPVASLLPPHSAKREHPCIF